MAFDLKSENWISTRGLSAVLMLSLERVRQLEEEGHLTSRMDKNRKQYDLVPSVQSYIEYLRQQKDNGPFDLANDEARRIKADADLKEAKAAIENMKKEEFEATMHRADDVEKVVSDLATAVRAELLALPGTLAIDVSHAETPAEAAGIIKAAVNRILNGLADYSYNPEKFKKLVREREKWMNETEDKEETEKNN